MQLGAVRRCVPDELLCEPPLVDAGYTECVDPLPVVEAIEVVTAVAGWRQQPVSVNPATVVGVPAAETADVSGELLLVVHGRWLTEPVAITVGAALCLSPSMRDVERNCTSAGYVDYARSVVCLLDRSIGVGELVSVTTGRGPRSVTVSSLRLDASVKGRLPLTLSADEPEVVSLTALAPAACNHTRLHNASLVNCSNSDTLSVEVCGVRLAHRYSASTGAVTAFVNITVAGEPVACKDWMFRFVDVSQCNDSAWSRIACYTQLLCGQCDVQPVMSRAVLTVGIWSRWPGGPLLSNTAQQADPLTRSFISFRSCAAGSYLVVNADSIMEHCDLCPAGWYTEQEGAQSCTACPLGTFSEQAGPGSTGCESCLPGTHSPEQGASVCVACSGSSWQPLPGTATCQVCAGGQYRTLPAPLVPAFPLPNSSDSISTADSNNSSSVEGATQGICWLCPTGAECFDNGSLLAQTGFYLVVTNRQLGHVGSLSCTTTACVGQPTGSANTSSSTQLLVLPVEATGVKLVNYCGPHRRLDTTNALCAECEPGYSEVRGVCVYCPSPSYGLLLLSLLLAWLLVYALHRFMLGVSSTSTIPILVYFTQMSRLFLPSNLFPPLNLLNLQLFTVLGTESTCVLRGTGWLRWWVALCRRWWCSSCWHPFWGFNWHYVLGRTQQLVEARSKCSESTTFYFRSTHPVLCLLRYPTSRMCSHHLWHH